MSERTYQTKKLIPKLRKMFPGCDIMLNDPSRKQGVPDILILWQHTWAMLEVKEASDSNRQPNQEHYIRHYNGMSFAAFINPENEEDVLNDLQQAFRSRGASCVPKPEHASLD